MSVELISEPLRVEALPDGRRELVRPLGLEIDGRYVWIPAGFDTDYSSWPRWLPGPKFSNCDYAGVVHDWLYRHGSWGEGMPISRREADQVWRKVARAGEAHVTWLGGWLGYAGLRIGAWWTWRRYRRRENDALRQEEEEG